MMKSLLGLLLILTFVEPDQRVTRNESVAGWRVRMIAENDGGQLVTLSRRASGWRFEYTLNFWRGNGGIYVGSTLRRGSCRSGDAEMLRPVEDALARASLDGWIADYLRECPLSAASEADLRRTLDAAWPLFARRAQEATAAMEAENEAIANHGRE